MNQAPRRVGRRNNSFSYGALSCKEIGVWLGIGSILWAQTIPNRSCSERCDNPLWRGEGIPGNVLHSDRNLRVGGGGGLYISSPSAQLHFSLSAFYFFFRSRGEWR